MKFSQNGLYIEQYIKCTNCGALIYENGPASTHVDGHVFCSQWCIDWSKARQVRRAQQEERAKA
ncbi:hypothetical protein [Glaciimonas sp. PCH181]|uniref:hypothetical protein n=1 Tax=Glaciimonas sp. PCH181 TaxID=2133943 RepID=UPI000D346276|nr:hypothetical protein [Glaciimonas sp. PCH181]PUA20397.1 hypothetical protein C7W93_11775 [Glaciimonas sp. PCH181]